MPASSSTGTASVSESEAQVVAQVRSALHVWEVQTRGDYDEAISIAEAIRDRVAREAALSLPVMAALLYVGRTDESLSLWAEHTALVGRRGVPALEARVQNQLGAALLERGNLEAAQAALAIAASQVDVDKDGSLAAVISMNLGVIDVLTGRDAAGACRFQEAVCYLRQVGNRRLLVSALHDLAVTYGRMGALQEAEDTWQSVLTDLREDIPERERTRIYIAYAVVLAQMGERATARRFVERSLAECEASGWRKVLTVGLIARGRLDREDGLKDEARRHLMRALSESRNASNAFLEAEVWEELAMLERAEADQPAADAALDHAVRLYRGLGSELAAQTVIRRLQTSGPRGATRAAQQQGVDSTLWPS